MMEHEKIRGCGRNGGAPKGNQNASKRPAQSVLDAYAARLGEISREQMAAELGVAVSTTRRWIPPKRTEFVDHETPDPLQPWGW